MASSTWRGHFGSLGPFSAAHEKLGPLAKPLPAPKALPVLDDSLRGACASLGGCRSYRWIGVAETSEQHLGFSCHEPSPPCFIMM